MARSTKSNALLSAVIFGLPAATLLGMSVSTRAQFRVGADGHYNDANNRAGSGGYNQATDASNRSGLNSNIVTGNVGGLSYFHGSNNGEFDGNVFQGNAASGNSDRLNTVAAPQGNPVARNTGEPNVTPYYSTDRFVTTPSNNFVTTPNGTGLIPAPRVSPLTPNPDGRIQEGNVDPAAENLAAPGETNMAGPVDPSGRQSLYSMSPLYGVRPAQNDNHNDSTIFNSRTSNSRTGTAIDRDKLDTAGVQKMRDELNQTALPDGQSGQPGSTDTTNSPGASNLTPGALLSPVSNGSSGTLSGTKSIDSNVNTQQLNGNLSSGQGMQSTLIVSPAKQSKQLAELERRFAKDKGKLTDVQASNRLNEEMIAQNKKAGHGSDQATKMGTSGAMGNSTMKPAIGIPIDPNAKTTNRTPLKSVLPGPDSEVNNTPYVVTSLATGIQAKGLADLMKSAEDQMRTGKFIEAVDTYQTAQQVASNNPFVPLGRSFAELGASYYGKADLDLNHAVDADPAILAGQYDLKGFIGEDRLKFVQKDLEDIAAHEKGARPVVLLAFIAHNTGDDKAAAKYLDDATIRGGYAKLIDQMRPAWGMK